MYHILLVGIHCMALISLLYTKGLSTNTYDFTVIYPVVAIVLPFCIYMGAETYHKFKKKVASGIPLDPITVNLASLRIATNLWIPWKVDQWGMTEAKRAYEHNDTIQKRYQNKSNNTDATTPGNKFNQSR